MEHALVLVGFLLALYFGFQGHLRAVDADVDVLLADTRQLGRHQVGAVLLGDVHLRAQRLGNAIGPAFEGQRADEKPLE